MAILALLFAGVLHFVWVEHSSKLLFLLFNVQGSHLRVSETPIRFNEAI